MNFLLETFKPKINKSLNSNKELLNNIITILKNNNYIYNIGVQQLRYRNYKFYTKNLYIGESIYKTSFKKNIVIYNEKFKNGLCILYKSQNVNGTVDEKFPFIELNIKQNKFETIMILGGFGQSQESVTWFKKQCFANEYLIDVINLNDFENWISKI